MYDDLYGVQGVEDEVLVWISQKGIVVCPLLSFYFFFSFSLFFFIFCGLNGSFYLTLICPLWDLLICPLWDLLICPLWDLFLTLGAILYILQEGRRSFTLYKGTQPKENVTIMMKMYASARVAGYAMILARHLAMITARPN